MKTIASAILLLASFVAHAGTDSAKDVKTLSGEAELGATVTTGNTETTSIKARIEVKQEFNRWENQYLFETLYKEDGGVETGKRLFGSIQSNYKLNELDYLFIKGSHEVDPFTGFDSNSIISTGYGHKFIDNGKTLLAVEAGPGFRYKRLDDESALIAGHDSEENMIAHGSVNFETAITKSSKFEQLFVVDYGSGLEGRSETSITANIIGALAMKFAVIVRYNGDPLEDKKSTDTETNMTLLYAF